MKEEMVKEMYYLAMEIFACIFFGLVSYMICTCFFFVTLLFCVPSLPPSFSLGLLLHNFHMPLHAHQGQCNIEQTEA
jgi:hypothetical protein